MTALVLAVNVGLCLSGLAALCLSLDRHHAEIFRARPGPGRRRALRLSGWSGIGLSLLVAGLWEGWNFGPVQWLGALTLAALVLVLLLAYRPRALVPAALLALLAAGGVLAGLLPHAT